MAREPFFTPLSLPHFDIVLMFDDVPKPKPKRMPSLKVSMLLHFHGIVGPFAPEERRTSQAYTQFVRELLRDGLVVRPTNEEREKYPGWAYRTTAKGDALVNAICSTPMPVERTRWVIPS